MLICQFCSLPFPGSKAYLNHLRLNHAIHYSGIEVNCGQNNCPRTFTNCRYLKMHLEKEHSHLIDASVSTIRSHAINSCAQFQEEQGHSTHTEHEFSMHVDNGDSSNESLNLTSSFMSFIGQLQSKANLSLANIQLITENMKVFLNDVAEYSCSKVRELASNSSTMPECVQNCVAAISDLPGSSQAYVL